MALSFITSECCNTWSQGSKLLEPLTIYLPLTSTISMVAFGILGFQYLAINFYRLAVGTLITGISFAYIKTSFQDQAQETFLSSSIKAVQEINRFLQKISESPSLKSPLTPLAGAVAFTIFSYFACNFIYRVSMGFLCIGFSSALLNAAATKKKMPQNNNEFDKGFSTFFGRNIASIRHIINKVREPASSTSSQNAAQTNPSPITPAVVAPD